MYLYFKLFINETAQKPWPLLTCSCPFVEVFLMHGIGLVSVGAMDDLAPKLLRTKSTCGMKVQHPLFQILTRPLHWRNFCSGWLSNNVHSWFSLFIGKYERNRNTYVVVGSTELEKLNFWQQRRKVWKIGSANNNRRFEFRKDWRSIYHTSSFKGQHCDFCIKPRVQQWDIYKSVFSNAGVQV